MQAGGPSSQTNTCLVVTARTALPSDGVQTVDMAQCDSDMSEGEHDKELAQYDSDISDAELARSDSDMSRDDDDVFRSDSDVITAERHPARTYVTAFKMASKNVPDVPGGCSTFQKKSCPRQPPTSQSYPGCAKVVSKISASLGVQTDFEEVAGHSVDDYSKSLALDRLNMNSSNGTGAMTPDPEAVTKLLSQGHDLDPEIMTRFLSNGPDLAEAVMDPVVLDNHFYNQWARLPREDPEQEWPPGNRRNAVTRMFSGNGSLKTWNLLNAIARDRGSAGDHQGGSPVSVYRYGYPLLIKPPMSNTDSGGQLSPRNGRRTALETSPQHSRDFTRSAEPALRRQHSLPPLASADDVPASTGCGVGSVEDPEAKAFDVVAVHEPEAKEVCLDKSFPKDSVECFFRGIPVTSLHSRGSRRGDRQRSGGTIHPTSDRQRLGRTGHPNCDRQRSGGTGHPSSDDTRSTSEMVSTPQPESLPLTTVSLLFNEEMDLRGQQYRYVDRRPRREVTQRRPHGARDVTPDRCHRNHAHARVKVTPSSGKQAEVTCVQFIDLKEAKTDVTADKGDVTGGTRSRLNVPGKVNNNFVSKYGGGFCHFGRRMRGKLLSKPYLAGLPLRIEPSKVNTD